MLVGHPRR
jgi:hypothetical protein